MHTVLCIRPIKLDLELQCLAKTKQRTVNARLVNCLALLTRMKLAVVKELMTLRHD